MRRITDTRNNFGVIWSCRTANFEVYLKLDEEYGYKYDGDDEDGTIQLGLDEGDLVAFSASVEVYADEWPDLCIGVDHLGGSVYRDGETHKFIHDGYFKDMLKEACDDARRTINNMPKLRALD